MTPTWSPGATILQDVRYALRRARSHAGFTAIAILSLALGIGANTAAFSLVNAVILRKTPIVRAERVAELDMFNQNGITGPLAYPDAKDLLQESPGVFSQLSVATIGVFPRDLGDNVETVMGELVNGDYFPLIGLPPVAGRLLGRDDDIARGAHPVVVLGYDYWKSAFAGDRQVVGRELRLAGRSYTIVGVAPKRIDGLLPGLTPSLYAPIQMINELEPTTRDELAQRSNHSYFVKVRLADGQTVAAARAVLERFTRDMQGLHPDQWSAQTMIRLIPLSQIAVSPIIDGVVVPAATVLMVVVGLVLIIACTNLASFLLAQARDRRREMAIRLALGASRRALVRQLLVESLLVAVAGGVLGAALSSIGLRALLAADLPVPLPISLDVGVDARVLAFVIATSVAAGLLLGLLPALRATRLDVIETIKNENAGATPGRWFTMRRGLVVMQTATSLVLLVTAALFLRSFAAQSRVGAGFGSAPAGMVWMALPARYGENRRQQAVDEIERRVRGIDGVGSVGVIKDMLVNAIGSNSQNVNVDGFQPPKGTAGFEIDATEADSGFFDAAGLTLVTGRLFNSADVPGREPVAIVSQAMAQRFWPGQEAVGRTFRSDSTIFHVIGVIKTTKVRSLGERPRPLILTAFSQSPSRIFMVVARTRADAALTATRMVSALRALDPALMIIQAKTMQTHLAVLLLPARLGAVAFALFAGLAVVLATIGVYGVVRYAVAQRAREVAIRLAIGARPEGVVRLLMREGLALVVSGAVLGIALAALASRGLASLLFGVGALDPIAFLAAPVLLTAIGALAAFLPARRASRVDPASALRAE